MDSIKKKPIEDITDTINRHMEKQGKKAIRAVKKLQSGDIAIQAVNKEEAENLRGKSSWGNIFGEKTKAVKPIYGVIVFNVRTDKINPKEAEKSIDMIKERSYAAWKYLG